MAIKTVVFSSAGADATTSLVATEAAIASNLTNEHVVATYSHDIVGITKACGPELGVYKFYLIQVRFRNSRHCTPVLPQSHISLVFLSRYSENSPEYSEFLYLCGNI